MMRQKPLQSVESDLAGRVTEMLSQGIKEMLSRGRFPEIPEGFPAFPESLVHDSVEVPVASPPMRVLKLRCGYSRAMQEPWEVHARSLHGLLKAIADKPDHDKFVVELTERLGETWGEDSKIVVLGRSTGYIFDCTWIEVY